MMLVREESGRYMTVGLRDAKGKNELNRLFQLDLMKHF